WPPSPWRSLRALISTWYHKLQAERDEDTIRRIIEKLSASPLYFLPKASLGHSRPYMPLYREAATMVIDTFAASDSESRLIIEWPQIDLSTEERSALSKLLDRIGYLGRAESWIEAGLAEDPSAQANCIPLNEDSTLPNGFEGIQTLAAMPTQEYSGWRAKEVEMKRSRRLAELGDVSKLKKKELDKIEHSLPADLFGALHADTSELKKAGWSQPPGSVWIYYARPRDAFAAMPHAAKFEGHQD